jgi:hypothetical protein
MKGYVEIATPLIGPRFVYSKAYTKNGLRIMVTREQMGGPLRWHMSISHSNRYPVWDEIKEARYALIPDQVTMGMLLPPRSEYVNLHPNCFHLHEIVE